MTATPDFDVVATDGRVEHRRYVPYVVAEVDVTASNTRDAANAGFRPLANYIFGANVPNSTIEMTAPVTAEPAGQTGAGQRIAMTAPVTAQGSDGTYTVRFAMPVEWTMATLPEPTDPSIRLVALQSEDMLAIGFRGRNDQRRIDSGSAQLVAYAEANGLAADGEPMWAGYSSPAVPLPLRRWEMLLRVTAQD